MKVMIEVDWYVKVVLTLIAVLLVGLLVKPYIIAKSVGASNIFSNEFLKGFEEGREKREIYKELLTPLSDEYSKKARANKGEYSIVSTGKAGVVWVLEKRTGRLVLLSGVFDKVQIFSDVYLDEILKWDSD